MGFFEWLLVVLAIFTIAFMVGFILKLYYDEGGFGMTKIYRELARREAKEPEVEYVQAKVLRKRVLVYYKSEINIPKSEMEYRVVFLLENGDEKDLLVSQETFEKTQEQQVGTLVLMNGRFFDFGDGEDVED